ncbi:hypothetical protein [Sphingosinicella soli]|uniref:Uncharacterized protein n=1 Tax=Sphingosinicella soli TaxID=333708 RepID=A0A7W7B4K2_9SPHN|nr:hypothetical protein [Sphingosinicella soli]MBB4633894.1 hypothetical protein [Sphingosinicella soli]
MNLASSPPSSTGVHEALIIDAARCWREARDGDSPLPTLFSRLEQRRVGVLAPSLNALFAVHQAWSGRRFRTAASESAGLTEDERHLLQLLHGGVNAVPYGAKRPSLSGPLQIALRSTRVMLRRVLESENPA